MNRYIVLTEDCSCGHKHLHYARALDCLDRFEDHGMAALIATIAPENRQVNPLWIDKCLGKWTPITEMAAALGA